MGQMANLKQLLVSLVACITVACTHAFPYYWSNDFSTTCFDVPMKPYRRHGAPTPDRSVTFQLKTLTGTLARGACPGTKYRLVVNFPEPRHALISTTIGSFVGATQELRRKCPNRALTIQTYGLEQGRRSSWEVPLTFPCQAKGTATILVTSATGSSSNFRKTSFALPLGGNCPKTC